MSTWIILLLAWMIITVTYVIYITLLWRYVRGESGGILAKVITWSPLNFLLSGAKWRMFMRFSVLNVVVAFLTAYVLTSTLLYPSPILFWIDVSVAFVVLEFFLGFVFVSLDLVARKLAATIITGALVVCWLFESLYNFRPIFQTYERQQRENSAQEMPENLQRIMNQLHEDELNATHTSPYTDPPDITDFSGSR